MTDIITWPSRCHGRIFHCKQTHFITYFPKQRDIIVFISDDRHWPSTIASTRKMTIFHTPRPLFDGIIFLTARDVDFILKWHTTYTTCVAHYHVYTKKKLFEFLKYNNTCSLTAILNESISKLCGLSMKYAQIWGTVKIYALMV
jgi:hypothetical protein